PCALIHQRRSASPGARHDRDGRVPRLEEQSADRQRCRRAGGHARRRPAGHRLPPAGRVQLLEELRRDDGRDRRAAVANPRRAPGGIEIIPMPPHASNPGDPKNARHPGDFAPSQRLILWPYFDFTDDRWTLGSNYVLLRQDPKKGPTKIGLGHPVPWVAYLNQGTLFVKRFRHHQWAEYPDLGTSYQTFSNEDMLEMETVGALVTLGPGQSAELE